MFRIALFGLLSAIAISILAKPAMALRKGKWHAILLSTDTCEGHKEHSAVINLNTKRIDEYSSVVSGYMNITEQLVSPIKMVVFTYSEGSDGNIFKKFSVTYKDICETMLDEDNIFIQPIFDGSNLPRRCPIKVGVYQWSNVSYRLEGECVGLAPVGVHRGELHAYSGNKEVLCLRATVEISMTRRSRA